MESIYILYSPRMQGWFTTASTYSTDMNEAKVYTREDALAMCRKHKSGAGYNLIPVRQDDVLAI